ncbi:hypothetical protein DFH07DRAFT_949911 [Mycena maculata]|uniref:Uncharacterized protein n=1 Tax=Mycena maculata TaxID=230809 RepID=A0AAD7NYL2_9AGAR|nr:hypothetical protein DFH07DRAFT_949911 [Mycena maculata]
MSSQFYSDYQSQTGQRYNFTPSSRTYDEFGNPEPSSDDGPRATTPSEDPAVLVDLLANNYDLTIEYRSDLHSFLEVARGLPPKELKIVLIQQATTLANQQHLIETKAICSMINETVTKVSASLSVNARITKEQISEIGAACKVVFYSGRCYNFSNEDLKAEVIPYLEKHSAVNGLEILFKTKTNHKLLTASVGRVLSYTKTWLRRTFITSIPDAAKNNCGLSVTALTTLLAKKCLLGSENAKAKHAIWVLIVRSFIRNNTNLRVVLGLDASDDDDDDEFSAAVSADPPPTVPAKRNHAGTPITVLWMERNQKYTPDLQSPGWTEYINACLKKELTLFPSDPLALIVGNKSSGGTAPAAAASAMGCLSGVLGGTGPRQPMTPNASNANPTALPGIFSGQPPFRTMDDLMNTATPFTFGNSTSRSGLTLPPLNPQAEGSSRHRN